MKKTILALSTTVALTAVAPAITLLSESFTYTDGALAGNGTWVNHSGTPGTALVTGGAAVITQDAGSEDVNVSFAEQTGGIITASFDLTVSAPAAMTGTDFEYFAHFYPSSDGFDFRARTDIQTPNGGGDYTIGISTDSSTSEIALPVDFSFGAVVPVVVSFDIDGGTASLTAGGSTVNTTTVSLGQVIDAFALRQSSSSSDETLTIDNLVISNNAVPEPSSSALLGLAGLATLIRRKR